MHFPRKNAKTGKAVKMRQRWGATNADCEIIRWRTAVRKAAVFLFIGYLQAGKPSQPSGCQSILKENSKLRICKSPVTGGHSPLFWDLADAHINYLADRIVRGEDRFWLCEGLSWKTNKRSQPQAILRSAILFDNVSIMRVLSCILKYGTPSMSFP